MERRLAAIISADIVGPLLASGEPEQAAFGRLETSRHDLITEETSKHGGHIVAVSGDNFLAEFASVVEAMECAVVINAGMAARNAGLPDKNRVELRIGIDLGDITIAGDRFSGEGIDVARHIGQHASPGDICVSLAAHDQVRDKLQQSFSFAGEIDADDLMRPVRVYRLDKGGCRPSKRFGTGRTRIRKGIAALAGCAVIVLGVAAAHYLGPNVNRASVATAANTQPTALADEAEGAREDQLIKLALEVTFWSSIKDAGDPVVIQGYIARYPEGQFTPVARARLVDLQANGQMENRVPEQKTPAVSRTAVITQWQSEFLAELKRQVLTELQVQETKELAEWRVIRASFEPAVLQSYLIKYPDGAYAALARDQMAAAKRQQLSRLQASLETNPRAVQSPDAPADDGLTELGLTMTIQQHLARLGCDPGRPDGVWGAKSRRALRAFARQSETTLTGLAPSQNVLEALAGVDGDQLSGSGVCAANLKQQKNLQEARAAAEPIASHDVENQCGICATDRQQLEFNPYMAEKVCGQEYLHRNRLRACIAGSDTWNAKKQRRPSVNAAVNNRRQVYKKTTASARQRAQPKNTQQQCGRCNIYGNPFDGFSDADIRTLCGRNYLRAKAFDLCQ